MSNIGNKQTMSKNLKYYVERTNKMQKEVAEDLGVAASTFTEWIKGNKYPRIDKIELMANYFGIKKSDLIEEKLTPQLEQKNDALADIVIRLRTDDDFLSVVEMLYTQDAKKIAGVKQMLSAFLK